MNGKLFDLEIINHQKALFNEKCDFVVAPTVTGEIGILHGHIPLMSVISKGRIRVYKSRVLVKEIETGSGFIEVTHGRVNILLSDNRN